MLLKSTKSQFNIGRLPQTYGIAGFILTGSGTITILFRGLGPKLGDIGFADVVTDLQMVLHPASDSSSNIEINDNWDHTGGTSQSSGTLPSNVPHNLYELQTNPDPSWRQFDPDISSSYNPGRSYTDIGPLHTADCLFWHTFTLTGTPQNYTVVLDGVSGATGTGRLEMYVQQATSSASLSQVSTRGDLEGQNIVLSNEIEIFNSAGNVNIIQRALGPSLTSSGVTNVTPNPSVELYDSSGCLLAQNDDWQQGATDFPGQTLVPRSSEYNTLFGSVTDVYEGMLYNTLVPDSYTLVTRAKGFSGVGLNEVYISPV